jgi:hypothetical protein
MYQDLLDERDPPTALTDSSGEETKTNKEKPKTKNGKGAKPPSSKGGKSGTSVPDS